MAKTKGFTLIELLVVIAIIGLLASIVLVSVNSARAKAKDTAIKASIKEFEKLLHLEYSETGSYANLQRGWWYPGDNACNQVGQFTGNYAAQAVAICSSIIANAGNANGDNKFLTVTQIAGDRTQVYSIVAVLNTGNYYCAGSSGFTDEAIHYGNNNIPGYPDGFPGCPWNP